MKTAGKVIAGTTAGVVILVGGYGGLAAMRADQIPSGTTVDGTTVGGLTAAQAKTKVDAAAKQTLARPITIRTDKGNVQIVPADSGMSLDTSAALAGLTGFTLEPSAVVGHYTGDGPDRQAEATIDQAKLQTAIAAAAEKIKGAPVNPKVEFHSGSVEVIDGSAGTGIDAAAVAKQIAAGWPGTTTYTATLVRSQPEVSAAEVATYVDSFANKAMSNPVTVAVGSQKVTITPTMVSGVLSTGVQNGRLTPVVDDAALSTLLKTVAGTLVKAPVAPRIIQAKDGKRTVVPGADGSSVVTTGNGSKLIAALTSPDRTLTLTTTPVKSTGTVDPAKVGTQLMSQFATHLPGGASNSARTHNIQVGLSRINGMVVQPGQQFSLLSALGPIDASGGYVQAPTISGGVEKLGNGGGLSQVSTTLYNATFFAGLKEDAHKAHSFWISRYPMGREATLTVPMTDNKWTNDSGAPLLIQAGIEGASVVIRLYGTPAFTVASTTSQPFDVIPPKTRYISTPGCIAQPPVNGFKVTVTRVVKDKSGKVVKNESLTTQYGVADRVVCTGKTADTTLQGNR